MRTYQELNQAEQERAREVALNELLEAVMDGLRFNDEANGDDLQARIEAAGEKANAMQTPWFWGSYIMDTCRGDLESMAAADAEDALYPDKTERIIHL